MKKQPLPDESQETARIKKLAELISFGVPLKGEFDLDEIERAKAWLIRNLPEA